MKVFLVFASFILCSRVFALGHRIVRKGKEPKALRIKLPVFKQRGKEYHPQLVDWSSVITGCKAACRFDKRLCNFYVRAAAHDSLSVSEGYGGADGSLMLTEDELRRSENSYDNFAYLLSKNALALATRFNSSVADVVAVCGAVATEFLGGPKIIKYDAHQPFFVGRHDRDIPNPANALAPANMNTTGFVAFAENRNLTIEEMTALMGSHALLDEKGCKRQDGTYCNPKETNCTDLMMYSWTNVYFKELCTPKIRINHPPALSTLPLPTREFFNQQEMCKFTSGKFRQRALDILAQEIVDPLGLNDPNAFVGGQDIEYEDVTWYNASGIAKKWEYTVNDAWLGKACQGDFDKSDIKHRANINIGKSMHAFRDSPTYWNTVYIRAYKKMINIGAIWNKKGGFAITGNECVSGYISTIANVDCRICKVKVNYKFPSSCPSTCKCKTAFSETDSFYM